MADHRAENTPRSDPERASSAGTPTPSSLAWPEQQPTLAGPGIVLRPLLEADIDAITAACQDDDIQRWTSVPVPYERAHSEEFVREVGPRMWAERAGANFAVADARTNELLGSAGLVRVTGERSAEIGYWCAPGARGRGITALAVRLIAEWALVDIGFPRIELLTEIDNRPSRAVAWRAGFQEEGILRLFIAPRGKQRDGVMHSIIRADVVRPSQPGG